MIEIICATAAAPTLNIDKTGAKAIVRYNSSGPVSNVIWAAGAVLDFVYDGTNWVVVGGLW